jgi:hypothetical protein
MEVNTSFRNEFHDNTMGRTPNGIIDPNGLDYWWDGFVANTANCWFKNVGKDGTRGTLTSSPPPPPSESGPSIPGTLPHDCASSVGTAANPGAETELLGCLAQFDQGVESGCTWFTTPPEPQP